MLSSRFVGSARGDIMGGRTLSEHCAKSSPRIKDYTLSHSKKALADLGFIEEVSPYFDLLNESFRYVHLL